MFLGALCTRVLLDHLFARQDPGFGLGILIMYPAQYICQSLPIDRSIQPGGIVVAAIG